MLNSSPPEAAESAQTDSDAVEAIVRSGPRGAVALAGLATLIVVLLWLAFYLFVFVPRATAL
ncbi:MAG TPA: hypothetical protein VKV96_03150 [Roseiarcus sp.]|nr:hypothetical protein [Roseiarcus sp.]